MGRTEAASQLLIEGTEKEARQPTRSSFLKAENVLHHTHTKVKPASFVAASALHARALLFHGARVNGALICA